MHQSHLFVVFQERENLAYRFSLSCGSDLSFSTGCSLRRSPAFSQKPGFWCGVRYSRRAEDAQELRHAEARTGSASRAIVTSSSKTCGANMASSLNDFRFSSMLDS